MKSISSFISNEGGDDVQIPDDEKLLEKTYSSAGSIPNKNSKHVQDRHLSLIHELYDFHPKPYTEIEWQNILNSSNSSDFNINNEKLVYSLRKGLPDKLRGKIWIHLSEAKSTAIIHDIDIFNKLLEFNDEEVANLINKDIDRTILVESNNKNEFGVLILDREKKNNLFNVLKAYAAYDSEVRYCQGTNFIVAILLSNIKSKRYTFWTFVNIMNKNKWRDLFTKNTPKLLRMIDLLENSIKKNLPILYVHFQKEDFVVEFAAVFSQFFFTIFSYSVPIEYCFRVMDLFFILEEKIIFECILKLLSLKQDKLLTLDLEGIFHYIRSDLVKECIKEYGIEGSLPDSIFNTKFR